MEANSGTEASGLMEFPIILGVDRATSLPPGVADPAEQDQYLLINPFSQGVLLLQSGEDVDRGDLLMEMVMSSSLADGRKGPPPASKASVEALRTVEGLDESECSICMEKFGMAVMAKEMPCGHAYHSVCIERWLDMHGSCPICRYMMPEEEKTKKNDEAEDDDTQGSVSSISLTIWFRGSDGNQASSQTQQ